MRGPVDFASVNAAAMAALPAVLERILRGKHGPIREGLQRRL